MPLSRSSFNWPSLTSEWMISFRFTQGLETCFQGANFLSDASRIFFLNVIIESDYRHSTNSGSLISDQHYLFLVFNLHIDGGYWRNDLCVWLCFYGLLEIYPCVGLNIKVLWTCPKLVLVSLTLFLRQNRSNKLETDILVNGEKFMAVNPCLKWKCWRIICVCCLNCTNCIFWEV